jgi:hypothetical protein
VDATASVRALLAAAAFALVATLWRRASLALAEVSRLGDAHEAGRRGDADRRLGRPRRLADLHARRNRDSGRLAQQISLATGRLVALVATVWGANPVASVLLGVLVLQEWLDRTPAWQAVVTMGDARGRASRAPS